MTIDKKPTFLVFRTALVGKFTRGEMVAGREARLTGLEEDEHGVKIPVLERREEDSDHLHRRQIGQYNFICKGATWGIMRLYFRETIIL